MVSDPIDLEFARRKHRVGLKRVVLFAANRLLHHDGQLGLFLDSIEPACVRDDIASGKIRTTVILFKH